MFLSTASITPFGSGVLDLASGDFAFLEKNLQVKAKCKKFESFISKA